MSTSDFRFDKVKYINKSLPRKQKNVFRIRLTEIFAVKKGNTNRKFFHSARTEMKTTIA